MTDSTTRPLRTSRLDTGAFTAAEIQTMARFVGISVDKVRRLTECSVLIAKLDRAAPDAGLQELTRYDLDGDTFTPSKSGDYIMAEDVGALAAAPDAGLREVARLMDGIIRHVETWSTPPTDGFLDDLRSVRAALAAHPAPAGPAVHMKQSGNGCVTCSRKWSEHTDAEKRELE